MTIWDRGCGPIYLVFCELCMARIERWINGVRVINGVMINGVRVIDLVSRALNGLPGSGTQWDMHSKTTPDPTFSNRCQRFLSARSLLSKMIALISSSGPPHERYEIATSFTG